MESDVIGYRAWQLTTDGYGSPILMSCFLSVFWEGPALTADVLPALDNGNGIYCKKQMRPSLRLYGCVLGSIALSGIVVEGTDGYRAEHAVIRSLKIMENTLPDLPLVVIADALERRYHVSVEYDALEIETRRQAQQRRDPMLRDVPLYS